LLLAAIGVVRAGAQAQAVHAMPSRREHSSAAALLADDVEALLSRSRLLRASRAPRALLEHPWTATLALAALAFVAVGAAGIATSRRAGVAGATALAFVEASLIILSFVAFGRMLGLRDAARHTAR
jgi:hypothetical protein